MTNISPLDQKDCERRRSQSFIHQILLFTFFLLSTLVVSSCFRSEEESKRIKTKDEKALGVSNEVEELYLQGEALGNPVSLHIVRTKDATEESTRQFREQVDATRTIITEPKITLPGIGGGFLDNFFGSLTSGPWGGIITTLLGGLGIAVGTRKVTQNQDKKAKEAAIAEEQVKHELAWDKLGVTEAMKEQLKKANKAKEEAQNRAKKD